MYSVVSEKNAIRPEYSKEKLETNSHNHILQSLTMDTYLDIHKLTVPYPEANTVISKLPAVAGVRRGGKREHKKC
jgi:hypothetical protein